MAQAIPLQPVIGTITSFLISTFTAVIWPSLCRVLVLLQPATLAIMIKLLCPLNHLLCGA
jgi:hypothetical protein